MSSDGEISVRVNAEGTEDAVGEMGGDAGGGVPGGGDGGDGGDGGGRGGGKFGKLLTRIAGLLALLGPILSVLGVVSDVLEAFVAPLAVVLLRLLQPVLASLIKVLPVWFDIVDKIGSVAENTGPLLQMLGAVGLISSYLLNLIGATDSVKNAVSKIDEKIADTIETLFTNLRTQLGVAPGKNPIPDLVGLGDREPFGGQGLIEFLRGGEIPNNNGNNTVDNQNNRPIVNLGGGLSSFIDRVERDPNTDI